MTVKSISPKGSVTPQAIHVNNITTSWDELAEFSWQEWSTSSGLRAGIHRLAPLIDDDTEEQIGEDNYARFKADGAIAAVRTGGRWSPLKLGQWLVKTHEDELRILAVDEFVGEYDIIPTEGEKQ
ncbi:hypothetical protein ACFWMS_28235 [Peribacillus butanolivorans]|uniref:hypothetical protein n=1 Tax=Peribacillus butanolivorans TaxID=421767 RepID=UPI003651EA5F